MKKTVMIVSLSAGTLGEDFARHELTLGLARLEAMGLNVKFSAHALRGRDYLARNPQARAADLLEAFQDPETDLILSAIGGDDTYRLLPYLFGRGELAQAVDLPKATAHGLLASLRLGGAVEQSGVDGKYRLGVRLFEYGCAVSASWDVVSRSRE